MEDVNVVNLDEYFDFDDDLEGVAREDVVVEGITQDEMEDIVGLDAEVDSENSYHSLHIYN